MATIVFRRASQKVYIYVYGKNPKTGKTETFQVPRAKTKHLDGLPPKDVQAWADSYEADNGFSIEKISKIMPGKKLLSLFTAYQNHRLAMTSRLGKQTLRQEKSSFEAYVLPYFVKLHRKQDPKTWHGLIPGLHSFLVQQVIEHGRSKGKNLSAGYVKDLLWLVKRFGEYLVYIQYMPFPFSVAIPKRGNLKTTPLKVRISPEELMFKVAGLRDYRGEKSEHVFYAKLLVLICYFTSIRPEEVLALTRDDFLTGDKAKANTKTYQGFTECGLGSGLSVRINKSLKDKQVVSVLKSSYSFGVVNIWYQPAAKQIARILSELPFGERLFPFSIHYNYLLWKEHVQTVLNATMKDMRRSSLLYLGRTKRIPPTLLQEHARHSELSTTMLYCRDPLEPEELKIADQNLDDIV